LREALEQIRQGGGVVVEIRDPIEPMTSIQSNRNIPRLKLKALDPHKILKKPVDNR